MCLFPARKQLLRRFQADEAAWSRRDQTLRGCWRAAGARTWRPSSPRTRGARTLSLRARLAGRLRIQGGALFEAHRFGMGSGLQAPMSRHLGQFARKHPSSVPLIVQIAAQELPGQGSPGGAVQAQQGRGWRRRHRGWAGDTGLGHGSIEPWADRGAIGPCRNLSANPLIIDRK